MNIILKDLKKISDTDEIFLEKYLNLFEGNDIFEKFVNILKTWENDVSFDTKIVSNGKQINVTISYIIQEVEKYDNAPFWVNVDDFSFFINTPTTFKRDHDIFKINNLLKAVKRENYFVDLCDKSQEEIDLLIEKLPPQLFRRLMDGILEKDTKTVNFDNPALKNQFFINFLGNQPYEFLKSLFSPYDKDYYRDIIYHLSRRIDGDILMHSTMMDIDYYMNKMAQEGDSANNSLNLY